ncbi:DUF397 domain-containing protein [Streptomyces sp. TRM75563]|uniref:DUF397 domain-containing protein n=1 Tax=Streptomyces sp. TRM75563 TaxID=2817418 RepID=UPI001F6195A8|nr:DUF397 domain-containing protein [Streptomyces sp. TRM75563]MCI4045489.1 DUF397 domain-containing protein [Streptomyces sp. TRM75563]
MITIPDASSLHVTWWKSSASGAQGDCVECGLLDSAVAVRDSKHPTGPALVISRDALAAMVGAVADGTL